MSDTSASLIRELQSKVARQREDLKLKNDTIRQLREDKAKLLLDLKEARRLDQ